MDHSLYLQETSFLDLSNQDLRQRTLTLTAGISDIREQVKSLFFFVRDEIRYNPYTSFSEPEDYLASTILQRGEGFCIPKASLFTAMLRILKIPAKLYFADIKNHKAPRKLTDIMGNLFLFHCYSGVLIENQWLKLAPTFNREMFAKIRVRANDFDGRRDALLPAADLDGKLFVEYIRDRGDNSDIPFAEIVTSFKQHYGKDIISKWQQSSSADCRS
ncbi:MAG: transglutaminase family protein [Deltaproteobacteria bacterium]|nr:transglutaminase family protein [Deltaproteobacteria bacterium]